MDGCGTSFEGSRQSNGMASGLQLAPKALCHFSLGHRPRIEIAEPQSAESAFQSDGSAIAH
jgi:hypothetical protein